MSVSQMLWLGSAAITSVIAAYYGVLATHRWFRSRSLLGPTLPETRETLRRLLAVSRQGNSLTLIRLTLFYGGLSFLVVAVAAREWPGLRNWGHTLIIIIKDLGLALTSIIGNCKLTLKNVCRARRTLKTLRIFKTG